LGFLDTDPDVLAYDYECMKIPYVSNVRSKKVRNYIPDFLVTRSTGQTIVEIKPTRFLTKRAVAKKLAAGREYAAAHDMQYQVMTEVELKALGLI
jgi:hypothetical protein